MSFFKQAPGIEPTEDGWKCTRCGGEDYCDCLGGMSDPICDCGWPAYACRCEEFEEVNGFHPGEFVTIHRRKRRP